MEGTLQELGLIRKSSSFMTSICDERGDELLYAGIPISHVLEQDIGIGGVLSLLWFQVCFSLPENNLKKCKSTSFYFSLGNHLCKVFVVLHGLYKLNIKIVTEATARLRK